MKLLLDECLPHPLRLAITGHDVFTIDSMGWKGIKNGRLLALAASAGFEAMITSDLGMEHSQNPRTLPIAIFLLHAPSNAVEDLLPLVPELLATLTTSPAKAFLHIENTAGG